MGYWKDVGEVLKRGVDLAAHEIKDGAETIIEKGRDEISMIQHRKEFKEKHQELERLLTELGDLAHTLYHEKKDIFKNKEFKDKMLQVDECEQACKLIEKGMKKEAA